MSLSGKRVVRSRIPPEQAGRELLDWLCERFNYRDRAAWLKIIEGGQFLSGEDVLGVEHVLRAGEVVEFCFEPRPEPEVDRGYRVVFEDEYLLVVDKPPCLPVHPAGAYFAHTLWYLLREERGLEDIHFISRLDRETSGLLLLARSKEVARACRKLDLEKTYLVAVEGEFPESLEARGCLQPDVGSLIRKRRLFVMAGDSAAEAAQDVCTHFVRRRFAAGLSLVEARLETGRTHQIRATLAALRFPVVGDKIYGVDEGCFLRFLEDSLTEEDWRKLRLPHQALHSWRLRFIHPCTAEELSFEAPLPKAMKRLFP